MLPIPLDEHVSSRMKSVRSTGSKLERAMYQCLEAEHIKFEYQGAIDPLVKTKVDFLIRDFQIAIFVNSCFWHVCPKHCSWPKNNASWWSEKLIKNVRRDHKIDRFLRRYGWAVIHVWEHEKFSHAIMRIKCMIKKRAKIMEQD